MTGGILEVLLVNTEGIKHRTFFGKSKYYVIIKCGNEIHRSKISSEKDEKTHWNGKFMFDFPHSKWQNLNHLQLTIMEKEHFGGGGFIGQTTIHLGEVITKGYEKGFMELTPAPYNVVLEDDTYKGLIRVGLKFVAKKEERSEIRECEVKEELIRTRECEVKQVREEHTGTREYKAKKSHRHSIYKAVASVWKLSWLRLFSRKRTSCRNKKKQIYKDSMRE